MGHFGCHCPDAQFMATMNLAPLQRTAPTRSLPNEHNTTKTDHVQGTNIPTPRVTDNTPTTMVTDMGDISTNHNPTTIPTMTGAVVSEGTHCTPHPTTTAAHNTLWLMDAPIAICTITHSTSIVTCHPTLATFSADITHATML